MKLFYALALLALSFSNSVLAKDFTKDWNLFPDGVPSAVESALISVPKSATTARDVGVSLFVGVPFGCNRTMVTVEHKDNYTHVIKPEVVAASSPCLQISRFDAQRVSLGRLLVGQHQLIVENVAKPVEPVTFWVSDGESLATH